MSRDADRDLERVLARLDVADCWEWTGALSKSGYGATTIGSRSDGTLRSVRVHRFIWESLVGPVGEPTLDHLCRNKKCANPDHLEPVSHRTNVLRNFGPVARNARKTHCVDGHLLDEANTYRTPDGNRQCRKCNARRTRAWREIHPNRKAA